MENFSVKLQVILDEQIEMEAHSLDAHLVDAMKILCLQHRCWSVVEMSDFLFFCWLNYSVRNSTQNLKHVCLQ